MNDILCHMMSLVDIIYYVALSHLNKTTYQYTKYNNCKILDLCIKGNETKLYHYFKDYYRLDIEKVKTTLVLYSRFDLINDIIIDYNVFIYSIYSNNISMVKYVINRYKYIVDNDILDAVAEMDNLEIFKLLVHTSTSARTQFIQLLLKYYSYNLIEYMRFRVTDRKIFERYLLHQANIKQNQYLIDYFQEHDYGNH